MSHYTTDYTGLSGRERYIQAIKDVQFWLGDGYHKVTMNIVYGLSTGHKRDVVMLAISLTGVDGYPAKAFYAYCYKQMLKAGGNNNEF